MSLTETEISTLGQNYFRFETERLPSVSYYTQEVKYTQENKYDQFIEGPSKFIEEISDEWQRFDFFNEGTLPTKPSSTGLTILRHA